MSLFVYLHLFRNYVIIYSEIKNCYKEVNILGIPIFFIAFIIVIVLVIGGVSSLVRSNKDKNSDEDDSSKLL
ncbi:MAG: hypothetical protein AB7S96_04400 [Candidatus Izemoplasmatales bacterium]